MIDIKGLKALLDEIFYALETYLKNGGIVMATGKTGLRYGLNGYLIKRSVKWLLPITGLLALIWFLVRVIPKPSRATYPCQRVAFPLASSFVVWLFGLAGSVAFLRKSKQLLRRCRYVVATMCFAAAVFTLWWSMSMTGLPVTAGTFTPSNPVNSPMGVAKGIYPGRVVWVYDPNSTSWDGSTGYWSDHIDQAVVTDMFSKSIRWLTGESNDSDSWDALFRHFNNRHGKGDTGYQANEKIAVKINLVNCQSYSHPGNNSYNSPQLVYALLKQLINNAGVAASDITVYDASRYIPPTIYDLCTTGDLSDVRFEDSTGINDGNTVIYQAQHDPCAPIFHANGDIPTRWPPYCVTQAEYVINLAHLKAHFYAGVTLCAKNHFGSTWVQEESRFWPGSPIHLHVNAYYQYFNPTHPFNAMPRPMGSYNPLVELMGHPELGEKTVLFVVDGLYAAKHQGALISESPKWQSEPFNNDWTSSVFVSQDCVAIDSVCTDFLRSEPTITCVADTNNYSTADDYLHEAALADDPPSGTYYDPAGGGEKLDSLGVHEHWNNSTDKQYTRNIDHANGCGIELISSEPPTKITGDVDSDGDVDADDLGVLAKYWLEEVGPCCRGDLNYDSDVDFFDFVILADGWLE